MLAGIRDSYILEEDRLVLLCREPEIEALE
jgi:hypothetical protein